MAAIRVSVSGRSAPLGRRAAARAVHTVFAGERRTGDLSVAFVGRTRMRRLHRMWKGLDRPTDVLSFALQGPDGRLQGDVYVCREVAARQARALGRPVREELLRLVVHGTLHVLGYDHSEDERRTASAMWRRQERYLACLG